MSSLTNPLALELLRRIASHAVRLGAPMELPSLSTAAA